MTFELLLKHLFFALWMLPQNVIGFIYLIFVNKTKICSIINQEDMPVCMVKKVGGGGSVSLGSFIFISEYANPNTEAHELGHTVQSMYLGPLYLLIIGLPSICWALLRRKGYFKNSSYYEFYTEKWADKIAGIAR